MGPEDITRTEPSSVPAPSRTGARFSSGDILGGRYRIVSLLGKGGMGEVYRAEDLTLDQPVALKFLPADWSKNEDAIARFRNEVRVARQVSHPNVCRVYDLGEVQGLWFLSMEYVDGEDLGSLLRRIGRLPADKALEIARKLCAGLAAAHDKGILHRDLKPANVMLDRRGQVLLTDFGLAALAGEIARTDITSGTPAYMAPEQRAGEEVTVRSDIYSLGLVLYEIFTGKLPFESNESLTTLVRDVDPSVERVILRCLQAKSSLRPASAIAVAAALPGGDPLAAALAAGETPSPEMVVAAGEGEGLSPAIALPAFLFIVAALALTCLITVKRSAVELAAPRYSPEVLRAKARDLLPKLGYTGDPYDEAWDLVWAGEYFNWVAEHDKPKPDWNTVFSGTPSMLRFAYRTSPGPMTGAEFHTDLLTPGIVTMDDPPVTAGGMTRMQLDQNGRLTYFEARPPQRMDPAKGMPQVDWTPVFAAAGIDPTTLRPDEPLWTWLSTTDTRIAWTGVWPGSNRPLRVEAAALRGKPVGFQVQGPWTQPSRITGPEGSPFSNVGFLLQIGLLIAILVGAPLLARKNLLRGRGDRKGALRLALFLFVVHLLLWLCRSHVIASLGTFGMFLVAIVTSTFAAVLVWTIYLALEPYVRRNWPRTLISFTSVLAGKWNDAVVGRDILAGLTGGLFMLVIGQTLNWRSSNGQPHLTDTDTLLGIRGQIGVLLQQVPYGVRNALFFLFLLFLMRVLLRNQWLAAGAFAAIFTVLTTSGGAIDWAVGFTLQAIFAALLLRWGLLTGAVAYWIDNVMDIPITTHTDAWYHGHAVGVILLVLLMAGWALRTSMRGRALVPRGLFD